MATEKRLIDANKARVVAQRIYSDPVLVHAILNTLNETPTVDAVEVVHGRWLEDYETFVNDNGYESEPIQTGWVCSACGSHELSARNYCPNCGAKMDGDGNV